MINVPVTPSLTAPPTLPRGNWLRYLLIGLGVNAVLWGAALLYAKNAEPDYVSEWAVTLPATGTTTNVNLPDIGDASSQVQSPYSNTNTRDPRENYKFIASSEPVISKAAESLGMTVSEFGDPRIEIIDNTTLMAFEVEGTSSEEAQQKSLALYNALQSTLGQLRVREATQKNEGVETTLADAQEKLERAQARLSAYKAESGLTSSVQLDQISTNVEQLRRERALLMAQQQQARARFGQLSTNLNVSARQAANAFKLNADPLFQQNLQDYSQATAAVNVLSSQLGPNHPALVRERTRQEAAQAALLNRGRSLLGEPVNLSTLAQLNVGGGSDSNSGREALFQQTVTAQVDTQGLAAQVDALDRQIAQLEGRLKFMAQRGSTLDALTRDVTIAEAVFAATLARLDLSRADLFGSYPQIQLVTEPNLPEGNSPLKAKLALVGAAFGSLLLTLALITLWWRDRNAARYTLAPAHAGLDPLYPPESRNGHKPVPAGQADSTLVVQNTSEP